MNTLTASDLRKEYNGRLVVGGVSLKVNAGEVVGLLGPNGAGKTTSFYMIVGLIKPDSGSVLIDFDDITELPVYERARAGIGYLPQEASVFRNLTVRENINLVWEETGQRRYANELTEELLREFKITHIADTKGYSLSGGERRRVEIARALTLKPKFILLDEPFSGIDPIAVADIQSMIQDLKAQGYGVLITDHNVRETLSITDRTYLIHDGAIFLSGTPEEVAENELARKFYLGENFEWEGHVKHSEVLGGSLAGGVRNEELNENQEIKNDAELTPNDNKDNEIKITTAAEPDVKETPEENINIENNSDSDGLLLVKNTEE